MQVENRLAVHTKGGYITDERIVRAVPEPPFTATWHPHSHAAVLDALQGACDMEGIDIVKRAYSLSGNDGANMFGTWQLDLGGNGTMGYMLGFRNSVNKRLRIGVCAGTQVFVCDNLAFSGSFILFRKHTSGVDKEELIRIAHVAIQGAVIEMRKLHQWHKDLRHVYLPAPLRKQMTYDFMEQKVFAPSKFSNYQKAVEEEVELLGNDAFVDFKGHQATNMYALHGGVTRLLRGTGLLQLSEATGKMEKIINGYMADEYTISQAA